MLMVLIISASAVACKTQKTKKPKTGGTVVIGYLTEPELLNPLLDDFATTIDVAQPILPNFFTIKPDFTYEPSVLKETPTKENGGIEEDPFTVTYKIKDEAKWSDGKPISSADVKFTWETIMSDDWDIVSREGYEKIEEIQTPDAKTAVVVFKEPYAAWKDLWTGLNFIYPKHALKGMDINQVWNKSITVSGGPFKFKEWKQNKITLVRNENYWGKKAKLDKVIFKYTVDEENDVLLNELKNEEVDIIFPRGSFDVLKRVEKLPGVEVSNSEGMSLELLGLNTSAKKLEDKNIRKAIAYAVDRDALIDAFSGGQAKPLQSFILPQQEKFYKPSWSVYKKNISKAKELIEKSGYKAGTDGIYEKDGEKLSLIISTTAGNSSREKLEQIIQAQLKEAGIKIEIKNAAGETFYEMVDEGNYDLAIMGWDASPDPGSGATSVFASDMIPPNGYNSFFYKNDDVTTNLYLQETMTDENKRAAVFMKIQDDITDDVPVIPLSQSPVILAGLEKVKGYEANSTYEGPFWNIEEWWTEN